MKRLCIVILYDPDAVITESDFYLVKEVKTVASRMIVCVNADRDVDCEKLKDYTDEIIQRPNIGFDGGAVKQVLCDYIGKETLSEYDELFICNNSFFGPFKPMTEIFDQIGQMQCDFWGMTGENQNYTSIAYGVGSYFWGFRNCILRDVEFYQYFEKYVDASTNDFKEVCACYESGIDEFLGRKYRMGVLYDVNHLNIFEAGDKVMIDYGLPILKRKFFVEKRTTPERMQNACRYVRTTGYDVTWITDKIKRLYGIDVALEANGFCSPDIKEDDYRVICYKISDKAIADFIRENGEVYVFGAGLLASYMWQRYGREGGNIRGFVKSFRDTQTSFHGFPVLCVDELKGDEAILVALDAKNKKQVEPLLKGFRTLYL